MSKRSGLLLELALCAILVWAGWKFFQQRASRPARDAGHSQALQVEPNPQSEPASTQPAHEIHRRATARRRTPVRHSSDVSVSATSQQVTTVGSGVAPPAAEPNSPDPQAQAQAEAEAMTDAPDPAQLVPAAREALSYVGQDPAAEQIWLATINDPRVPADARRNLIEDLNEDGFPDPRNPTADDLPLIVSRLQLIESIGPDAADDVNRAAFEEAYKDLTNMYVRVTGGQ